MIDSGIGAVRAGDAQETSTQSDISPRISALAAETIKAIDQPKTIKPIDQTHKSIKPINHGLWVLLFYGFLGVGFTVNLLG